MELNLKQSLHLKISLPLSLLCQLLMTTMLDYIPSRPASYRRMAASTLHTITTHTRAPSTHASWLVNQLLS